MTHDAATLLLTCDRANAPGRARSDRQTAVGSAAAVEEQDAAAKEIVRNVRAA